ncbi:MAG TPA: EF-hand domain-containing protein [Rhodanobacter sp.]|nr:EF-hand domain-containing protein [Rhodanobacter sp.]
MKPLAIALGALLVGMAAGQTALAQDSTMPSSSTQKQSMMHDNMVMMWNAADTDHDGYLSKAEYDAYATSQFTKMDTNGDGKLSKSEMMAGEKRMHPKMSHAEMTKMWKAMDTDSKSAISQDQYMTHADTMFAKWDTNGDGKLSKDEMKAGMQAMKH